MSIYEYDKEKEEKKLRKAEYEAGIEFGKELTRQELIVNMYEEGLKPEQISKIVGLGLAEILKIVQKD